MIQNDFPENFVFRCIRFLFFCDTSPFIMMKFARQSRVLTLMSKHWFWLFGFFPLLIKSLVFFLVFFIFLVFTVVIFLYKITKNISFILGIFAKKKHQTISLVTIISRSFFRLSLVRFRCL